MLTATVWLLLTFSSSMSPMTVVEKFPSERACLDTRDEIRTYAKAHAVICVKANITFPLR